LRVITEKKKMWGLFFLETFVAQLQKGILLMYMVTLLIRTPPPHLGPI